MKNDPLLPPSPVPIPPHPQRSPIRKPKPLHWDLEIKPGQLVLFSLYSEASEENPKGSKERHGMGRLGPPARLLTRAQERHGLRRGLFIGAACAWRR